MKHSYLGLLIILLILQSGCSVLIGNVRPVDQKSTQYGILDLSKNSSDWKRMGVEEIKEDGSAPESGISDQSFQSKKTGATISINSTCKSYSTENTRNLKTLTRELLLGISDIEYQKEESIDIPGGEALQTTVQGQINQEKVMIRTVVVLKNNCVYDLMYVSRPGKFKESEEDFSRFVSSLRIR